MKIYLAATAPGNEKGNIYIPRRLLSYYLLKNEMMENHKVFEQIKEKKA